MFEIQQQSLFLKLTDHQLHIRHISPLNNPVKRGRVLMIHGSIENGRIYYNDKGRGLGCYLASQGFEVFVPDLRGRGKSQPQISKNAQHGQFEQVVEDIPALLEFVADTESPLYCVSHSWGGTLLTASLLRFPELAEKVAAKVHFGVKRRIRVKNAERFFKINLIWNTVAPLIARFYGYFPAKKLKIGAENEPKKQLSQVTRWFKDDQWLDVDGFDYNSAINTSKLPPSWFIGSEQDKALGAWSDINLFADELQLHSVKRTKLGKRFGNLQDYDHINVLTHKSAEQDHFPMVADWLAAH